MDLTLTPAAVLPPAAAPAQAAAPTGAGSRGFSNALDSAQRDVQRDKAPDPQRPAARDASRAERADKPRDGASRHGDAPPPAERGAAHGTDSAVNAVNADGTDSATTDAVSGSAAADAPAAPDLAALLPGWAAPAPAAAAAEATAKTAPNDLPLAADPHAQAARGRQPRDLPGLEATAASTGLDRALAGPAGTTPAADTLTALRDARAVLVAPDAAGGPAKPADALPALQPAWSAAPSAPAAGAPNPAAASATSHAAHQAHIAAPVDTPAFAPALGTTLSLLARDGVQQAQLSLHPAELGPVAVQIAIDGTQARVDFHAAHAATRAALEASVPELAAALRDAGLTLTGGGVFDQPRGQRQDETSFTTAGRASLDGDVDEADEAPLRLQASRPRGVVDLVA